LKYTRNSILKLTYEELNKNRSNKKKSRKKIIPRYVIREVYDCVLDEIFYTLDKERSIYLGRFGFLKWKTYKWGKRIRFVFYNKFKKELNSIDRKW